MNSNTTRQRLCNDFYCDCDLCQSYGEPKDRIRNFENSCCSLSVSEAALVSVALAEHVKSLRKEYAVARDEYHPEGWKFAKRLFDAEVLWHKVANV